MKTLNRGLLRSNKESKSQGDYYNNKTDGNSNLVSESKDTGNLLKLPAIVGYHPLTVIMNTGSEASYIDSSAAEILRNCMAKVSPLKIKVANCRDHTVNDEFKQE